MADNIEQLFERAKAGNRPAFDCLQEKLEMSVRRFARRLVGPSDSEDDILHVIIRLEP